MNIVSLLLQLALALATLQPSAAAVPSVSVVAPSAAIPSLTLPDPGSCASLEPFFSSACTACPVLDTDGLASAWAKVVDDLDTLCTDEQDLSIGSRAYTANLPTNCLGALAATLTICCADGFVGGCKIVGICAPDVKWPDDGLCKDAFVNFLDVCKKLIKQSVPPPSLLSPPFLLSPPAASCPFAAQFSEACSDLEGPGSDPTSAAASASAAICSALPSTTTGANPNPTIQPNPIPSPHPIPIPIPIPMPPIV